MKFFFQRLPLLGGMLLLGEALNLEPLFIDSHISLNSEGGLNLFLGNLLEEVHWS